MGSMKVADSLTARSLSIRISINSNGLDWHCSAYTLKRMKPSPDLSFKDDQGA